MQLVLSVPWASSCQVTTCVYSALSNTHEVFGIFVSDCCLLTLQGPWVDLGRRDITRHRVFPRSLYGCGAGLHRSCSWMLLLFHVWFIREVRGQKGLHPAFVVLIYWYKLFCGFLACICPGYHPRLRVRCCFPIYQNVCL